MATNVLILKLNIDTLVAKKNPSLFTEEHPLYGHVKENIITLQYEYIKWESAFDKQIHKENVIVFINITSPKLIYNYTKCIQFTLHNGIIWKLSDMNILQFMVLFEKKILHPLHSLKII